MHIHRMFIAGVIRKQRMYVCCEADVNFWLICLSIVDIRYLVVADFALSWSHATNTLLSKFTLWFATMELHLIIILNGCYFSFLPWEVINNWFFNGFRTTKVDFWKTINTLLLSYPSTEHVYKMDLSTQTVMASTGWCFYKPAKFSNPILMATK